MKHLVYAGTIAAAVLAVHLQPAQARPEAPWCAVISMGWGDVFWDCQYNSIEECRPNVIAGNRGFCNHNPAFQGPSAPGAEQPVKHGKHYKHRVKAD